MLKRRLHGAFFNIILFAVERSFVAPRIFFLSVLALAFCLQPWWLPGDVWPYDYSRWVETLFLLSFCIYTILFDCKRIYSVHDFLGLAFIIFFVLVFFACIEAESGWLSWVGGMRAVVWIFVLIILVSAFRQLPMHERRYFAFLMMAVIGIHLSYSVLGMLVLLQNMIVGPDYLISGFSNKNHAATFYVPTLLLLPGIKTLLQPRSPLSEMLFYTVGIILALMILVISSRGAFVSLVAALVVLLMAGLGGRSKRYILWVLFCLLGGGVIYSLLLYFQAAGLGDGKLVHPNVFSDSLRFVLWSHAWEGFLSSPWFGHGPLSYALNRELHVTHPHNILLVLLYEYGVLTVALASVVALFLVCRLWRERDRVESSFVALSGVAAVTAFLTHSMFSGGSMIPASVLVFSIALTFSLSEIREHHHEHFRVVRCWCASFLKLSMVAIALVYVAFVTRYWEVLPEQGRPEPRFWQYGEIAASAVSGL